MTDLFLYYCGSCGSVHTTIKDPPKYSCPVCGDFHWHSFVSEEDLDDKMQEQNKNNKVNFYTG